MVRAGRSIPQYNGGCALAKRLRSPPGERVAVPHASIPPGDAEGGGLNKYQGLAGDRQQRPLLRRSGFQARLRPSVDMTSDVKSREQLFFRLHPIFSFLQWKRRSQ